MRVFLKSVDLEILASKFLEYKQHFGNVDSIRTPPGWIHVNFRHQLDSTECRLRPDAVTDVVIDVVTDSVTVCMTAWVYVCPTRKTCSSQLRRVKSTRIQSAVPDLKMDVWKHGVSCVYKDCASEWLAQGIFCKFGRSRFCDCES
jgi:hypothetical protein